jgi:hypothetical protein
MRSPTSAVEGGFSSGMGQYAAICRLTTMKNSSRDCPGAGTMIMAASPVWRWIVSCRAEPGAVAEVRRCRERPRGGALALSDFWRRLLSGRKPIFLSTIPTRAMAT